MAAHGKLEEFNCRQEDWESYEERLQQYFVANGVEDADKRHAILLSACGQQTFAISWHLRNRQNVSLRTSPDIWRDTSVPNLRL